MYSLYHRYLVRFWAHIPAPHSGGRTSLPARAKVVLQSFKIVAMALGDALISSSAI